MILAGVRMVHAQGDLHMLFRVQSTSGSRYEHPLIVWDSDEDWADGTAEIQTLEELLQIAGVAGKAVVKPDMYGDGVPTIEIYDNYRE